VLRRQVPALCLRECRTKQFVARSGLITRGSNQQTDNAFFK
jgi:hypothetical protein